MTSTTTCAVVVLTCVLVVLPLVQSITFASIVTSYSAQTFHFALINASTASCAIKETYHLSGSGVLSNEFPLHNSTAQFVTIDFDTSQNSVHTLDAQTGHVQHVTVVPHHYSVPALSTDPSTGLTYGVQVLNAKSSIIQWTSSDEVKPLVEVESGYVVSPGMSAMSPQSHAFMGIFSSPNGTYSIRSYDVIARTRLTSAPFTAPHVYSMGWGSRPYALVSADDPHMHLWSIDLHTGHLEKEIAVVKGFDDSTSAAFVYEDVFWTSLLNGDVPHLVGINTSSGHVTDVPLSVDCLPVAIAVV